MALEWSLQSPAAESWQAVAWSPQRHLFAAVMAGQASDGKHAMTSPDGITWTKRDLDNELISNSWVSMAWSPDHGMFFGGGSGFGASTCVFTSQDGITWVERSAALGTVHSLNGAAASPTRMVVLGTIGANATGFTSTNGTTWSNLSSLTDSLNRNWRAVTYSATLGLFVAVASSGTGDRVMTSPDGLTWTSRSSAADQTWRSVAWSPVLKLFAAVSDDGTQRMMTSPDGLTWTLRSTPSPTSFWRDIVWSPAWGRFVAVASSGGSGSQVMSSTDGLTWVAETDAPSDNAWQSLDWSPELGIFAAVAASGTGRAMISTPTRFPADPRHWGDQLMFQLFDKEATYNISPTSWAADHACAMADYDAQAAHEEWDDELDDDEATLHGDEYPTLQVITRQSVRWTYHEPRTKPNSLAGLLGLALGDLTTDQDEDLDAYRHRLRPTTSISLPSISAQTRHAGGLQYRYAGIKSDGFTLESNGAYLGLRCPLIGSGYRIEANEDFAPAIDEAWLRWGDARVYLRHTAGTTIELPDDPLQGETNLGEDAVDLSTRIRQWRLIHGNRLATDAGYRPSSGLYRTTFHPVRRETTIRLEIDCVDDAEELLLGHYLTQSTLALELNLDSGLAIDGGDYRYGLVLIVPRVRFRKVERDETQEFDTLIMDGRVHSDRTNPVVQAWVFNAQPVYLG